MEGAEMGQVQPFLEEQRRAHTTVGQEQLLARLRQVITST